MAPRKSVRSVKNVNNVNYSKLTLSDALCPICRCILIQPVTLPCNHDFCLPCFEGTLANANLTCPLCRVRFSSWHRAAKKDNRIVNLKLWEVLQGKFSKHIQNRLHGVDENLEEDSVKIKLTSPGVIRKEYETQRRQQELELLRIKEAEEKASAKLIKKLKEEEEYEQIIREEKIRFDEKVARQLAKEMGYVPKPSASKIKEIPKKRYSIEKFINNMKNNTSSNSEKTGKKELPQFLQDMINKTESKKPNSSLPLMKESDNNNLIENDCKFFKPIDRRNIPPSISTFSIIRVPAISNKTDAGELNSPHGTKNFIHNPFESAFARFETTSPILGIPHIVPERYSRKRKLTENLSPDKKQPGCVKNLKSLSKQTIPTLKKRPSIRNFCDASEVSKIFQTPTAAAGSGREYSGSPFAGFDMSEIESPMCTVSETNEEQRKKQEIDDLAFAKKLQEQFNKERYSTRSSITCRENIKKSRQATLTEIISTSKCK